MLQKGSGHKMLREIWVVMGGFGHHRQLSSGSPVTEAAKHSVGQVQGQCQ